MNFRSITQVDIRAKLSRYSDLFLAAMVVGIVAMMIVPLPTVVLDILIATNISIAVILLLVSIYVSNPLNIASLPSILLITTLYRLGLNVSSTRLILLNADAGTVIRSFGDFVVAGNLVVGAVIFLILTLIQFVVIAKGSERVAEVAARFTLDAMPGKQMAIDADLRSGSIDGEEARGQRVQLQRESQLYGSMDGAMKFVKGDAIAGILITIVNIIGGLLIGVFQLGMTALDSARVYGVLTIGDGLVSQIPALLISTAAGIVVTRVASEKEDAHLGWDIGQQVLRQPKAIIIACGLLVLLSIVPGLPMFPFLVLAALCGVVGIGLQMQKRGVEAKMAPNMDSLKEEGHPISPIGLNVGSGLAKFVSFSGSEGKFTKELLPGLRRLVRDELGITVPGVEVTVEPDLSPQDYVILLHNVPIAQGSILPDKVAALAPAKMLEEFGIDSVEQVDLPGVSSPSCLLSDESSEVLEAQGIQIVDPSTQMVLHLGQVLRANAFELIGIQETQQLLDNLEVAYPALVNEVVPKIVAVKTVSEVLQRLVEEGISVGNLRQILETLAEWGMAEQDPLLLSEYVRVALRRQISFSYAGSEGDLLALMLDPMIEDAVRDSIQKTSKGSYLTMEPDLCQEIVDAVSKALEKSAPLDKRFVVLTNKEVRPYVRRLLEVGFPFLPVLAFDELLPKVRISPIGKVSV